MLSKCLTCVAAILAAVGSHGAVTIIIQQVGSDVVATSSGALDISSAASLNFSNNVNVSSVRADTSTLYVGAPSSPVDYYSLTSAPANLGAGNDSFAATSGTGDMIALLGSGNAFAVPTGSSGTVNFNGSATWAGTSIAGIGLAPGIYEYLFPDDSITIEVVPEPAVFALSASVLIFLSVVLVRRRRS